MANNWNMVWLQPRRSGGTAAFDVGGAGRDPAPSPRPPTAAMERRVERLCRQTVSSALKRDAPQMKRYHAMSYMDADKVSWSKQDLRRDCESVIWTECGALRTSTKI